jgi:GxxExxY protein
LIDLSGEFIGNGINRLTNKALQISMIENELSNTVIGYCIDVHSALGPGLLESTYKECVFYKLMNAGLYVEKEKAIPLVYKAVKLDCGYRVDLLVESKLIVEIKSVASLNDLHLAQTLTYLKLGDYKLGLLINFNVVRLKEGIKRVVNKL